MKNITIKLFPLFLLLFLSACFNYETQFDGPYKDGDDTTKELPKVLVYVAGGDVYLANEFASEPINIDNSGTVEVASVNNDHTKALYKRQNQKIQVYDIDSREIESEVPGSETAIWFDYHNNNETIYYLTEDSKLYTYGPDVLVHQPINLRTHSPVTGDAKGVTVLENGNFVFSLVSSLSGNRYLIMSDGTNILDIDQTIYYKRHFRLNKSEKVLWVGDEYDYFLTYYQMPDLEELGDFSGTIIGVPTNNLFSGYSISSSNEIVTPESEKVQITAGQLTCIDY